MILKLNIGENVISGIKNNISFKGTYLTESLVCMREKNMMKLDKTIEMCNSMYPANDIFLGSDETGELVVHVQKINPLMFLLEEDVLKNIKMSLEEAVSLIKITSALNAAHNACWNKQPPFAEEKIKNIDEMDSWEIAKNVAEVIDDFNTAYPPEKN